MARQMKDSGVEWIGEIPEEWGVLPLGNCFDERNEKVSDYDWEPLSVTKQGIVKQLETAAKSDAHDARKKVCEKDFVINSRSDRKQSCGISAYDGSVSLINIVLSSRFLKTEYVKYLLKNYGFAEEFYRWGTGIVADLWSTKYERMKKIMIPIPNDDEQQKIADFLDEKVGEIDSVIAKTKETIEDYKKYKQAIITDAVTKGLNPDVEMKESGVEWIGDIPKYWKIFRIKNIAKEIGDGLHSTPEYDGNGDVFFINGNNIGDEYLNIKENTNKLNETEREKYKLPLLNENTIMIALNGATYGKTSFYNGEKVLLGKSAGYITLSETCNKRYVRYFLQSYSAKYFMALSLNGTTIQNLSLNTLNNFYITFPDMEEQQRIVEFLDIKCSEIDKLLAKKEELLADLEDYKKSFIYEYVTGKKEVE